MARKEDIDKCLYAISQLESISKNYKRIKDSPGYWTYLFEGVKIAGKVANIGKEIPEIAAEVKDIDTKEAAVIGGAAYDCVMTWKDIILG